MARVWRTASGALARGRLLARRALAAIAYRARANRAASLIAAAFPLFAAAALLIAYLDYIGRP